MSILKPRRKVAVALKYDAEKDAAPKVLLKARDAFVKKAIDLAREHNIAVYEDPDLAALLSTLPEGREIPTDLYGAVAEVLAYCYYLNGEMKETSD